MKIILDDPYFITSKSTGFKLIELRDGKTRAGEMVKREVSRGYFSNSPECVKRYLREIQASENIQATLEEYVRKVEESNQKTVERIVSLIAMQTGEEDAPEA